MIKKDKKEKELLYMLCLIKYPFPYFSWEILKCPGGNCKKQNTESLIGH